MSVTLRYWAAAQAASGVEAEEVEAGQVTDILAAATVRHPGLDQVVGVATVLADGVQVRGDARVPDGTTLEILPPFAGG